MRRRARKFLLDEAPREEPMSEEAPQDEEADEDEASEETASGGRRRSFRSRPRRRGFPFEGWRRGGVRGG